MNRILTENRAGRFLFDVVSGKASDLLLLQKEGLWKRSFGGNWAPTPRIQRQAKPLGGYL